MAKGVPSDGVEFKLNLSVQGWVSLQANEHNEETQIPIVSVTEDIKVFDEFLLFILKKYNVKSL